MIGVLERVGVRVSLIFLASWILLATFADVVASDLPLVASRAGELVLLPGFTQPDAAGEAATPGAADWALSAPISRHSSLGQAIHGARATSITAGLVLALALAIGLAGGLWAGYGSALADALLARAVELTGALPILVLLVVARSSGELPPLASFVLVVGVLRGIRTARLVRGEVLRVSGQEFVVAARALGTSSLGVMRRHVLPHVLGPVLVSATFTLAAVVGLEAALSLSGLGPAATVSWGAQLGSGNALWPALGVISTTLALYVVADALDDALSARRGRPARALQRLGK